MDGSLAERRQRDISPGNVESPRASERAQDRRGVGRAERRGGGRMKGDEVEGWRRGMERDAAAHARGGEEARGC